MTTFANLESRWPGLTIRELNIQAARIEVTTHNDPEPRYIAGRRTYEISLVCNETAMNRLWAILQDPDAVSRVPAPPMPVIEPTTRQVTLPED